jgi:hypothetical protein
MLLLMGVGVAWVRACAEVHVGLSGRPYPDLL